MHVQQTKRIDMEFLYIFDNYVAKVFHSLMHHNQCNKMVYVPN